MDMNNKPIYSPSILSANFARLEDEIRSVEEAGANWIHIDVMDGHFVPNITMGPFVVSTVNQISQLPLDVHLMIENPNKYLSDFAKAGADILTVHLEACPHIHRTIQHIHDLGCSAGVAINPGTPPLMLKEILSMIDVVLVMTVNPGYSGQEFIVTSPEKIQRTSNLISRINGHAIIEVDGGITPLTLPSTYHAGARIFVAASSVFKHPQGASVGLKELIDSTPEDSEM